MIIHIIILTQMINLSLVRLQFRSCTGLFEIRNNFYFIQYSMFLIFFFFNNYGTTQLHTNYNIINFFFWRGTLRLKIKTSTLIFQENVCNKISY